MAHIKRNGAFLLFEDTPGFFHSAKFIRWLKMLEQGGCLTRDLHIREHKSRSYHEQNQKRNE